MHGTCSIFQYNTLVSVALVQTVPFVVEVCTGFVNAHGLDNQGIYRVPGNNGAITMLQNELDKVHGLLLNFL